MSAFIDFTNKKPICADLKISTMTVTYQFDTNFYIDNIGKYIDLSPTRIITVKIKNNMVRSVIPLKVSKKKVKILKKAFYNQITLKMASIYKKKPVNVKLFENGSVQMTGCICIEDCIYALDQLCEEFRKIKGVIENGTIVPKQYVRNIAAMNLDNLKNIKVVMINTNYRIGFGINRTALYKALLLDNVDCIYEPCVHACVNIKYPYSTNEQISIFIFESGAIIITGARIKDHIVKAYNFTVEKIYKYFNIIINNDAVDIMRISKISTCMEDMKQILNLKPRIVLD